MECCETFRVYCQEQYAVGPLVKVFQDYTTNYIVNFCYHNEHIYVYVFVCFVFVIYYMTYKYFPTSWARSIFISTLQPWIAIVVIDVFITTPTRQKSVLKA